MKKYYFDFISLFFLFFLINAKLPFETGLLNQNEFFDNYDSITIKNPSGEKMFNLTNSLDNITKFSLNLSISIPDNNFDYDYDELSFEIIEEKGNITGVDISFCFKDIEHECIKGEDNSITLKLSDIVSGNYYMIIEKIKEEEKEEEKEKEVEKEEEKEIEKEEENKEKEEENKDEEVENMEEEVENEKEKEDEKENVEKIEDENGREVYRSEGYRD